MPRRPPPAAGPAMEKMEKAFNDLANTIVPQDSCNFQHTSLEDVRQAALEIERELAARQSLRNMRRLMPLFSGLEHYGASMSVACNGTPFLPWVWAPITLILRIASEYVEAFENIIKAYARMAGSLKRFEILGKAFSGNSEFGFTLATFYEDILEFHKHAYKFVRRNGWKILFLTSWGRFQRRFENILDNMERHGALIDHEANARNIAEAQEMRHDLRSWREETLSNLSQQEDTQLEKQYRSILSWLKKDQSDQLAIMDTILTEISKYPDVYICVRDCTKVKAWLQRNTTASMLWIQGIPGCGKTFIAAQLIRYLRIAKMPFLYHFCSYSYATSLTYDQILRSLISQVVMGDKDLVAFVCNHYVFGRKLPSLHVLEELLGNLLAASSSEPRRTEFKWIILDGLDECSPEHQAQMLRFTNRIIEKLSSFSSLGNTVCKFLIASQYSPEISRRVRKEHTLSLSNERSVVEKAIQQYVNQRLQPLYQKFRSLELSERQLQSISETVVRKADAMFLYARLVLDYLSTNIFMNEEEIRLSLDQLPAKLTDLYEKILAQMLGKLDERSVNHIRCVLGWVAFQKRPLKRLEFLSAVSFSQGNPNIKNLAPAYIFDICGPLLDQRPDTTTTFVHSSVKTFLRTSNMLSVKEEEVIEEHSLATIACLLSGFDVFGGEVDDHSRRLRTVKGIHGLHVYSTEFWTDYLLSASQLPGGLKDGSLLLKNAYALAEELEAVDGHAKSGTAESAIELGTECVDIRLRSLEGHPLLFKHVNTSLSLRSLKALEFSYSERQSTATDVSLSTTHINRVLVAYQETVRFLLSQNDYPGVSAETLKSFKAQFSSALFTCRLHSCPRATCGFETQDLLHEHELSHARRYPCLFPGCQYPPFGSPETLRRHNRKYHDPTPPAKIRHQRTRGRNCGRTPVEFDRSQGLRRVLGDSDNGPVQLNYSVLPRGTPSLRSPQAPIISQTKLPAHEISQSVTSASQFASVRQRDESFPSFNPSGSVHQFNTVNPENGTNHSWLASMQSQSRNHEAVPSEANQGVQYSLGDVSPATSWNSFSPPGSPFSYPVSPHSEIPDPTLQPRVANQGMHYSLGDVSPTASWNSFLRPISPFSMPVSPNFETPNPILLPYSSPQGETSNTMTEFVDNNPGPPYESPTLPESIMENPAFPTLNLEYNPPTSEDYLYHPSSVDSISFPGYFGMEDFRNTANHNLRWSTKGPVSISGQDLVPPSEELSSTPSGDPKNGP